MFTSFEHIYRFAINVVVFIIGASIFTGFIGLCHVFNYTANAVIISVIAGLLASIITSGYLHVLLMIPMQMHRKFDPIKNKVALKAYSSVDDFQEEIAHFITNFFRYPGANIVGGYFHFNGANPIKYGENLPEFTPELLNQKTVKINSKHTAFFINLSLENQNLGKMILISRGISLAILKPLLNDFENLLLDDQLLHVINQQQLKK